MQGKQYFLLMAWISLNGIGNKNLKLPADKETALVVGASEARRVTGISYLLKSHKRCPSKANSLNLSSAIAAIASFNDAKLTFVYPVILAVRSAFTSLAAPAKSLLRAFASARIRYISPVLKILPSATFSLEAPYAPPAYFAIRCDGLPAADSKGSSLK